MSELPTVHRVTKADLARFDRKVGLPVALTVLRARLSFGGLLKVLFRYVISSLRDPLAGVSDDSWPEELEPLVRHQLRAAMRLDDATRGVGGLDEQTRRDVIREVIAETGARFIGAAVPLPNAADWQNASTDERERFAKEAAASFINAKTQNITVGDEAASFDVCECRFAQLTRIIDRPYLAPMFCEADSVHFARPESMVRLRRKSTIAEGANVCDFRLEFMG
jgi:hypothetical protein